MKVLLIALTLIATPIVRAQQADMDAIKRDIRILASIMETAFDEDNGSRSWSGRDLDVAGTYLRHQGMVLRIESHHNFAPMHFDMPHIEMPPMPEIAAVMPPDIEFDVDVNMDETWDAYEEAIESMQEAVMEANEQVRERSQSDELRDQMRKMRDEQRKILRENKRVIRELRSKVARRDLSEAEQKTLNQDIATRQQDLAEAAEKYSAQINEIREQQRIEWEKQQETFESKIVEVLCDYGSALHALPDNEHLTVIFDEGAYSEDGDERDRIYVFNKADLIECREGRMDKATLLQRGDSYAF